MRHSAYSSSSSSSSSGKFKGHAVQPSMSPSKATMAALLVVGVAVGYLTGWAVMETAEVIMDSKGKHHLHFGHVALASEAGIAGQQQQQAGTAGGGAAQKQTERRQQAEQGQAQGGQKGADTKEPVYDSKTGRWRGDTIHSLITSSGDNYQNYQTRIFWSSYKIVQKMPGGERMTGFTRILHRTVPDVLMDEVPTFRAKPLKPQCDGWCDYPVANRPDAILQWINAAGKDPNMVQGAWVLMLECDHVFAKPMQVPGSAWDPNVPAVQFLFDYIIPDHPNAAPHIKKLFNDGDISLITRAGPAPVMMRFSEWQLVGPDYVRLAAAIEADEPTKKALDWVREMYAWDVAIALHNYTTRSGKILTQHPPESITIVQPPFDEGMGNASIFHYTWGPYYYDMDQGKKLIYKWEKREMNSNEVVIKPPEIPLPPDFKPNILLEFDAPLTLPRHKLVIEFVNTMNRAIREVPELKTKAWR